MFDKILTAIIVFGFSFLAFAIGTMMIVNKGDYRTISLENISGMATATPDFAKIRVSIDTESRESKDLASQAFSETNKNLKNILAKYNIEDKELQFENISTNEWYYDDKAEDGSTIRKKAYSMTQYLTISLEGEKFAKFSDLTRELSILKNLSMNGVEKGVKNPEKLYDAARENALKKAKEQAETMAKNLGVRLGKVVSVETRNAGNDFGTPVFAQAKVENMTDEIAGMTSEDEYSVAVDVVYEIK